MRLVTIAALLAAAATPVAASAAVRITEFMYQGAAGANREFFEITNIGDTAVNISGWSYNDSNAADPVTFASVGATTIGANESIVFTELTAAAFRTYWGLAGSVQVYSIGNSSNLGNGDQVNIYNSVTQSALTLVDGITYNSGTTPGVSNNRPVGGSGTVAGTSFVASSLGDVYGSRYAGAAGSSDLANPGVYPLAAVPEPASWAMMTIGFGALGGAMRRRRVRSAFA